MTRWHVLSALSALALAWSVAGVLRIHNRATGKWQEVITPSATVETPGLGEGVVAG